MVSGSASLVEVTRSQPSSAVVGDQIASLPVLERNFLSLAQLMPGAAPDQRPNRFSITKFGGAADQRNSFTTIIDGGDIDDVIQGNPTINLSQDAVQEFKVFRNQFDAQYRQRPDRRGRGGLEVGHQRDARHRLLLRARRRDERQERLRPGQARVPAGAGSAARPAGRCCATGPSSSPPTSTTTSTTCGSSPCRRTIRSPPPRTAPSPRAAPTTCSTPSSTTASTTATRCSSATRSTTSSSCATATPPRTPARATTSARPTAWSAKAPRSCRPAW